MSLQYFVFKKIMKRTMPRGEDLIERRKQTDKLTEVQPLAKGVLLRPAEIANVPVESAYTENASEDKLILFLHGGGYHMGSIASYRYFASDMAKATGVRVMTVEYRLSPENPFPAAIEDVIAVYRNLISGGMLPKNIVFAGNSAGGGLCLAASFALRDNAEALPAALILYSPWTDLTMSSASVKNNTAIDVLLIPEEQNIAAQRYANGEDLRNPLISPLFGDFHGMPPILIHAGTDDIISDHSVNVAEKARTAGVDVILKMWKGMCHNFTIFERVIPEAKKSFCESAVYIKRHLGM
jgi:acetyl esterase/lipase